MNKVGASMFDDWWSPLPLYFVGHDNEGPGGAADERRGFLLLTINFDLQPAEQWYMYSRIMKPSVGDTVSFVDLDASHIVNGKVLSRPGRGSGNRGEGGAIQQTCFVVFVVWGGARPNVSFGFRLARAQKLCPGFSAWPPTPLRYASALSGNRYASHTPAFLVWARPRGGCAGSPLILAHGLRANSSGIDKSDWWRIG